MDLFHWILIVIIIIIALKYFAIKGSILRQDNNSSSESAITIFKEAIKSPIHNREILDVFIKRLIEKDGILYAIKIVQKNTKLGINESKAYVEAVRDGKKPSVDIIF